MLNFTEWIKLSESATRTSLKGWGAFGKDWRATTVAKDQILDAGDKLHDISLYIYRVSQFLQDIRNKLMTHSTDDDDNQNIRELIDGITERANELLELDTAKVVGERITVAFWLIVYINEDVRKIIYQATNLLSSDRSEMEKRTLRQMIAYLQKIGFVRFLTEKAAKLKAENPEWRK